MPLYEATILSSKGIRMSSVYYHLAPRRATSLHVGATFNAFEKYNWHYENMQKRMFGVRSTGGRYYSMLDVAEQLIAKREKLRTVIQSDLDYHNDPWNCLKDLHIVLEHSVKCLREEVFESVRKDSFKHCPSRQSAIWLIPDDRMALEHWKTLYAKIEQDFRVLRVRAIGKAHLGDNTFLIPRTLSVVQWKQEAKRYWQGEILNPLQREIIFTGEVTIIEEITQ